MVNGRCEMIDLPQLTQMSRVFFGAHAKFKLDFDACGTVTAFFFSQYFVVCVS